MAASMVAAAAFAAAITAGGGVVLQDDPPPAPAPQSGHVTGVVTPGAKIDKVWAISRATGQRRLADAWDPKTGQFAFRNLPGDARYDVCIQTADGRKFQGIDLDFVDARLLRLTEIRRGQLGLAAERTHTFDTEDAAWIARFVKDQRTFTDINRAIYIQGHGRYATALVEMIRTKEFVDSKGKMVWRVELWYFEHKFGGWEKLANQERVLERERIDPAQWRRVWLEYYPQLSVRVDASGRSAPVAFEIPAKPDPSRGRPADTAPRLDAAPHVLGLGSTGLSAPAAPPRAQER